MSFGIGGKADFGTTRKYARIASTRKIIRAEALMENLARIGAALRLSFSFAFLKMDRH